MRYQERQEGEIIPEGFSITRTSVADYYRARFNDLICTVRVAHDTGKTTIDYSVRN